MLSIYRKYQKLKNEEDEKISMNDYTPSSSDEELGLSERIPHRTSLKGVKEHVEEHFDRPEIVRDIIIGLSDGLTVPFALGAGLSSLGDNRIVLYGGLAGKIQTMERYILVLTIHFRAGIWCYINGFGRLFGS
jgi:hypothetical protein